MKKKSIITVLIIGLVIICAGCSKQESTTKPTNQVQSTSQSQQTDNTNAITTQPNTRKTEIRYTSYINARYGYSIEYPSTFVVKINPDNGDGLGYISSDTKTELTVSGINNINNDTVLSVYNDFLSKHGNLAYKKQEGNWFVASWVDGNNIVYQKTVVGSGSEDTFIIKYPISQKEYYDPIVSHLNSSFKTPAINLSH